jgi:hypothetical protein
MRRSQSLIVLKWRSSPKDCQGPLQDKKGQEQNGRAGSWLLSVDKKDEGMLNSIPSPL